MLSKSAGIRTTALVLLAAGLMLGLQVAQAGTPYPGPGRASIPGVIEAENYDADGSSVSYNDTTPNNAGGVYRADGVDIKVEQASAPSNQLEGTVVYNIVTGEWLQYSVAVATTGVYKLTMRCVSNVSNNTVQFTVDGTPITTVTPIPNSGNWARWGEFAWTVNLTAGDHDLRFTMVNGGNSTESLRVNWFKFESYSEAFDKPGLGYWHFDNDAGGPTVKDQTANVNDGTTNGTYSTDIPSVGFPVVLGASPITAAPNSAPRPDWLSHGGLRNTYSMDLERDSNQYVAVNDSASLDMGAGKSWCVDAWVKMETAGDKNNAATQQWLLHKKAAAADGYTDFAVLINGADLVNNATWINPEPPSYAGLTGQEIVVLFGTPEGTLQTVVSRITVKDPNGTPGAALWHYVAVSYNAAKQEVIFVVDNMPAERVTGVTPTNVANSGQLIIGGHVTAGGTADQTFDGKIDEVWLTDVPLPGTPSNTGLYGTPWFWENDGAWVDGMFTSAGKAVLRQRPAVRDKLTEDVNSLWQVEPVVGEPGNYCLRMLDNFDLYGSVPFWDHDTTLKAVNYTANDSTPQSLSRGVTWTARIKIDSFGRAELRNELPTTDKQKLFRFVSDLQGQSGATPTKAYFQLGLSYADEAAFSGIALYENNVTGLGAAKITDITPGQWYMLHAAAWTVTDGTVRHTIWVDGAEKMSYDLLTSKTTDYSPYIGFNDNSRRYMTDASIDYIKMSGAGAWTPAGVPLTPFPENTSGFCSDGVDNDLDGNTDCADTDCQGFRVCCPHNPVFDVNDDGDVDMVDFATFQTCMTVGAPSTFSGLSQECKCMDVAGTSGPDQVIDALDMNGFILCATGADAGPASPTCDD